MMRATGLAAASAVFLAAGATAEDIAAGEKSFSKCKACHQVGEKAKNGVGPVLNGLFGRQAGSVAGYKYSEANIKSGITWDEASFGKYIQDPKAAIPGTKMAFAGIKNEKEIADLTAFLRQFGTDGKVK